MNKSRVVALLCAVVISLSASAEKIPSYFKKLQYMPQKSSSLVEWRQIGPGNSGYCEKLWCHPTNDDVMFQSPDMYNSYGTWDGGKSWQTIKNCDGDGSDMRRVQAITFSHQNPNFGMAIDVTGALYRSEDMGRSWQRQEWFESKGRCSVLTVDPTDDKVWYMGSGDFWNVKFNHRTNAIMDDPTKGYFGQYVRYGELLRSTDGGKSWRVITKGLPEKSIKMFGNRKVTIGVEFGEIIVNPADPKCVVAITNYGVYRSEDRGLSWSPSGEGLPNDRPRDMDYYYNKESGEFTLFLIDQTNYSTASGEITSTGGVYKSTDCGLTWQSITGNLELDMTKITSWLNYNSSMKAVSFWLGEDAKAFTKEWGKRQSTALMPVWSRLCVNRTNPQEIYIVSNIKLDKSFAVGDVWKSEDGGETWFATARAGKYWADEKDKDYWLSRNNPIGANVKFAHIQPTFDRGEVWAGTRLLEINNRGEVFINIDQQTIRTSDRGKSWEQIDDYMSEEGSNYWVGRGDSNMPGRRILLDTGVEDRILLCSGEHGLWMSTPRPELEDSRDVAVKQIEGQLNHKGSHSIADVAVHPKNPDMIYTLQFRQDNSGTVRRSSDGGKSWETISHPIKSKHNQFRDNFFQSSLTIDPVECDNIYFVVMSNAVSDVSMQLATQPLSGYGVYKSADGGYTWSVKNEGLPEGSGLHSLAMDPRNHKRLYLALNGDTKQTIDGGLYRSEDGAESWEQVNIPPYIKAVNHVSFDPKGGAIYISCGTELSEIDEGGVWRSVNDGKTWEKIFHMPYMWQCEVSPLDSDIIVVSAAAQHRAKGIVKVNPGAYLSLDGGKSWNKINHNLGQPDKIVDIRPDNRDKNRLWCALIGSGWSVGYINR